MLRSTVALVASIFVLMIAQAVIANLKLPPDELVRISFFGGYLMCVISKFIESWFNYLSDKEKAQK